MLLVLVDVPLKNPEQRYLCVADNNVCLLLGNHNRTIHPRVMCKTYLLFFVY